MSMNKLLARLGKLNQKQADLNNPDKKKKGPSIKSALTTLERLERAQERERLAFIKELMEDKNSALCEHVEDFERIKNLLPVTSRGIHQAEEVLSSYREKKAYFEAQLYLLEKKVDAAQNDLDFLHNAQDNWAEFNAAVMSYTMECIEKVEEFDADAIIELWDSMMSEEDIAILNRGTTTFESLDYLFKQIEDEFANNPDGAKDILKEKIATLFNRYNIRETETPSEDI